MLTYLPRLVNIVCERPLNLYLLITLFFDRSPGPQMNESTKYSETYYKYVDSRPLHKNLIFLPKWNLTYCWTRKTASTSWNELFHFAHYKRKVKIEILLICKGDCNLGVVHRILLELSCEMYHGMFRLWQNGLFCFQAGYTKLERFLSKNQHTQRKLLNFENWSNGEVSKSAKIQFSKPIFYIKNHRNLYHFFY